MTGQGASQEIQRVTRSSPEFCETCEFSSSAEYTFDEGIPYPIPAIFRQNNRQEGASLIVGGTQLGKHCLGSARAPWLL